MNDFHGLAEKIALNEGLPVSRSWNDAFSPEPRFIFWVINASGLSDQAAVEAGLGLKARKSFPAVGIITGRTEEAAEALYGRSGSARDERIFAVNGEFPIGGGSWSAVPDVASLIPRLAEAYYVTFTGHGSGLIPICIEGGETTGILKFPTSIRFRTTIRFSTRVSFRTV